MGKAITKPHAGDEGGRVIDQSIKEWLAEYGGTPISEQSNSHTPQANPGPDEHNRELLYQGHRTTRKSTLALSFVDAQTGEEATLFFKGLHQIEWVNPI